MKTLTVGDTAPMFTLPDQEGNPVSLSSLLKTNRVLVYFYPKAMTPGCTIQAQNLRDYRDELAEKGVTIVGISPDAPKSLAKFTERDSLNFTLLADENHSVADQFGVWGPKKFMGKDYDGIHRISFLINKDGSVAEVFDSFKTKEHHQVVLAALD